MTFDNVYLFVPNLIGNDPGAILQVHYPNRKNLPYLGVGIFTETYRDIP